MNEKELYKKAVDTWGPDIQLIVLMEECGELIKECSKILRNRRLGKKGPLGYFIDELVDVTIMVEQMRYGWLPTFEERFKLTKYEKLRKVAKWLDSEFTGTISG